jgi:hypothetical protein
MKLIEIITAGIFAFILIAFIIYQHGHVIK